MKSIKLHRERLNLSRVELAERLNVHEETLARYERGDREPTASFLKATADLFGCSIDELITGNPPPPSAVESGAKSDSGNLSK